MSVAWLQNKWPGGGGARGFQAIYMYIYILYMYDFIHSFFFFVTYIPLRTG